MSDPSDSLDLIRSMWSFHDWARPRLLAACRTTDPDDLHRRGVIPGGVGDGSIHDALSHIAGCEWLWLRRWLGEGRARLPTGVDYADLQAIGSEWNATGHARAEYLTSLRADDLRRDVEYHRFSKGTDERLPLWQTLLHAANHSTHHRAEVCAALTGLRHPPETVDLIDYWRSTREPNR